MGKDSTTPKASETKTFDDANDIRIQSLFYRINDEFQTLPKSTDEITPDWVRKQIARFKSEYKLELDLTDTIFQCVGEDWRCIWNSKLQSRRR